MDDLGNLDESTVPSAEWAAVAAAQKQKEDLSNFIWDLPLKEFRALGYTPAPLPKDVPIAGADLIISERSITTRDHHEISLRVYKPIEVSSNALLFFNVHGGGWVVGNPQTEEAQNRFVAVQNHAVVVSVDYRRAPEFPFPYPLNDCYDAFIWCKQNAGVLGIDNEKIVIGGGSAGANLVASLAQICRSEGIGGIVGQVLNIPVTCHPQHFPKTDFRYTSYDQNIDAPIVSGTRMHWFWGKYLPDAQADPLASPLLAQSVEGLPPALIQVAGMDPLRDEGIAYASRLKDAGVEVTVRLYPGVPHAFYVYPELPQSRRYHETVVQWIAEIQDKTNAQ